jgi:hypothetical protein
MTRIPIRSLAGLVAGLCLVVRPAAGQQEKLAQTGMKFLSTSLDPRAAALGDAVTALDGGSEMLFYNPAGMASQTTLMTAAFGQLDWIADIKYDQASLALAPWGGRIGVIGFSLVSVDYGDLQGTVRADNEQGFLDTEIFSPSALAFGIGYARALTDRFSVGGQVKFVHQDLGANAQDYADDGGFVMASNKKDVTAFDFGVLYRTGFRSLTFAFSARNFSQEIKYVDESFQLPLTLKIGLAMDVLDLSTAGQGNTHSLRVSVDAENPRDYSEQIKLGAEYVFLETLSLRAGYAFPTDEQGISLGAGVFRRVGGIGIGADYAYTDFGVFSKVNRLALRVSL